MKDLLNRIVLLIKLSKRHQTYNYYELKNQNKAYKGPQWEDDEFQNSSNLDQQIYNYVKATIEYQQVDFKRWKKRNVGTNLDTRDETLVRSVLIILAGTFSVSILVYLGWFNYLSASKLAALTDTSRSFFTIPAALIGTLVASPVIFMVWMFRDKNNRIQIENSRKDTNLKDFQKLSEWASGFHLPEIKQTATAKTTNKTIKDIQENTEETSTSQEDFLAPEGSNSISRRQGAEALQASAIAQLEAFMFGKYGEQFMQPAFLLIHAIWESIITQQKAKNSEKKFEEILLDLHKKPIISALNKALVSAGGAHLKLFANSLIGLNLSGINSDIPPFRTLNLAGCDLRGMNLSYASLCWATLAYTNLTKVNLSNAILKFAQMQRAELDYSNLKYTNFAQARLQQASFTEADLSHTNFRMAEMQQVNLDKAKLKKTSFSGAKLQEATFTQTDLSESELYGAEINKKTVFGTQQDFTKNDTLYKVEIIWTDANQIRENVLCRGAIWDDDPNWLVGKIQDQNLLAKIFQDCEKRQANQN